MFMKIDYEQRTISKLIDINSYFLKGLIRQIRDNGELSEGSNRWKIVDNDKGIEYVIEMKVSKEKFNTLDEYRFD